VVPAVDVVILTWNDGALLQPAIDSALASTGVVVRVIVVDNGSDPPAAPAPSDRVTVVRNADNRGVAAARNQGVGLGSAPFVCVLDSDARLAPDCLRVLVDAVGADPRTALAGPVFVGQSVDASAGLAPTFSRKLARLVGATARYGTVRRSSDEAVWRVDFCIGPCQCFRRVAYDAVGGTDESFFYGPEDADFCMRLRRRSWNVVQVRDARCEHPPRRNSRRLFTRRGIRHAYAVTRFLARHRRFRRDVGLP
jgi:GT2 family glycosyltransferase